MSPERRQEAARALDAADHNKNVFVSVNPSDSFLQLTPVKVNNRTFYTVDDGETLMNREQAISFLSQWIDSTHIELTPYEYHQLTEAYDELSVVTKLASDVVALMPFKPDLPVSEEAHAALYELGQRINYPGMERYVKGMPF